MPQRLGCLYQKNGCFSELLVGFGFKLYPIQDNMYNKSTMMFFYYGDNSEQRTTP